MTVINYIKDRLDERSTYLFVVSSLGSVAALDHPFNYIGGVLLLLAALVPDNTKSA